MKCKLAQLMQEKDLDQKSLAEATGLSPTTVGKLYRNQFSRIDIDTVDTLSKYFDLREPNDLFYFAIED